ncbi:MAG: HAMP domain-containing protein [Armatimonadetes bacterium]|nr:HAMP domain-containing protein [Armatimonadota bacterium]
MPSAARRRPSLRQVLIFWYTVLPALGLLVLGLGVHAMVRYHLVRTGELRAFRMVMDQLRDEGGRGGRRRPHAPADLELRARDLAQNMAEPWTLVRIYGPQGQLWGASRAPRLTPVPPEPLWSPSDGLWSGRILEDPERPWQVVAIPLSTRAGPDPVVVVALSWIPSRDLLTALSHYQLLVGSGILLLLVVFSLLLARRLTRPLEGLVAVARRVEAGDLTARAHASGGTEEIVRLGGAIDSMVDRLEQMIAVQRRFVADASHELKTPLTSIGGMAEMLHRGADADPHDRELAIQTIEREVDRMSRLVSDLLALSRAEQETPEPSSAVAVRPLLQETAAYVRARSAHTVELAASELSVWARPDALERVLRNLVDNAVKYSSSGGAIRLAANPVGDRVEIRVEDQGIGISSEDLEHVFERFYRSDPARSRETGGTGLGLPIVAALLASMGGQIRLESTPGKGTTAVISLARTL